MEDAQKKINIYVEDGNEIHIREGKLPDITKPRSIDISGTIKTPADYFAHHKDDDSDSEQHINLKTAVVLADFTGRKIKLMVNPKDTQGKANDIVGELKEHSDLADSKVYYGGKEEPKTMNRKEFIKHIKFNNRFFIVGSETITNLLTSITKLQGRIDQSITQNSDTRGNAEERLEVAVKTEGVPEKIDMCFHLFEGFEKVKFTANICIEVTNGCLGFYLESPELATMIKEQSKTIIEAEIGRLTGLCIARIGG